MRCKFSSFQSAVVVIVTVLQIALNPSASAGQDASQELLFYGKGSLGDMAIVTLNGTQICEFEPFRRGGWICGTSIVDGAVDGDVEITFFRGKIGRERELLRLKFRIEDNAVDEAAGVVISSKVGSGMSLWRVAEAYAGFGAFWTSIYEQNRDRIRNQNLIFVGEEIWLPYNGEFLGVQEIGN